jgi:hypothetical protein
VPRSVPPHLLVLITLLIVVVWFMLLHHFRQSTSLQRYVAELFGENTPESALRNFLLAKQRLAEHLNHEALEPQARSDIELALGIEGDEHGNRQLGSKQEFSVTNNP